MDTTEPECQTSVDCPRGETCDESECVERICNGAGDCWGGDVCAPGELLGKNFSLRYCTATECTTDGNWDCSPGWECRSGICQYSESKPDVLVGDDAASEDVLEVIEPSVVDCKSCLSDTNCPEGFKCLPVGPTKYCLRDCLDGGDCPAGYFCFEASSDLKACLPVTYSCVSCAFDSPCEGGKCCDFATGECKHCQEECETCEQDFDCVVGLRCFKRQGADEGHCVEECTDGTCSNGSRFTCITQTSGVRLCQPKDPDCGGCGLGTYPKPDGSKCVKCLNSAHCAFGEVCNLLTNVCETGECAGGNKCSDGHCHQCCDNSDCSDVPSSTGTCLPEYTCEGLEPCGGTCASPYPVCAKINGIEQCVQCTTDARCKDIDPACSCTEEPLFSCVFSDGSVCMVPDGLCAATCLTDWDCPSGTNGEALSCHVVTPGSGICYNPSGSCDQATMCCGPGQVCFDIMAILNGTGGGGLPTMFGYCSCDSDSPCLGGGACTPTETICLIPMISDQFCTGGQLPAGMPANLCVDLASLLGGLI